ncbi:helix-turn-helix transcriptional regulator [Endozoicomonas sp.]|uniref:helix-turn-helix transcriptional regulator n=1 Tax=Endozoicomonas sp. TaxID=1892382 RepID=UPI00288694CD|nr:helix-turn-helix transcriptional regulator [Endozoicomonas sp.]
MPNPRRYTPYCIAAAELLGRQIQLGRKQRRWTESELAGRAGVSRATLQKIEKGDLSCTLGLVFEVACLVGVPLFEDNPASLAVKLDRTLDKIALLPQSIRKGYTEVDDDF